MEKPSAHFPRNPLSYKPYDKNNGRENERAVAYVIQRCRKVENRRRESVRRGRFYRIWARDVCRMYVATQQTDDDKCPLQCKRKKIREYSPNCRAEHGQPGLFLPHTLFIYRGVERRRPEAVRNNVHPVRKLNPTFAKRSDQCCN